MMVQHNVRIRTNPVNLMGVRIDPIDVTSLHRVIACEIKRSGHVLLNHVNVHCLNLAYGRPWLRTILNSSKITFCDGFGVILGARILGHTLPPRITYADWIWQLAEFAELQNFSFFFLGARPGVAERAASRLKERFQGVRILGVQHGYFSKDTGSLENESVLNKINRLRPNILIVGLGMPLQERWLMNNWNRIDANIGLTGGGIFDYVSGNVSRAPHWVTDHGLEWLGRLIIEPRRLWRRYLLGNPLFIYRIIKERFNMAR
jgi:N-acetylglucosaminyldiphosphoundecaprenol N-acetyl-beta-D-mannosaminyltransferase